MVGGRQGTGDRGQETGDRKQETGDRRQGTGDRRQGTGDRRQETGDRRQETGDRGQETGDRGQETGDRGQGTGDRGGRVARREATRRTADARVPVCKPGRRSRLHDLPVAGAMLAPAVMMGTTSPLLVFGSLCVVAAFSVWLLPESAGDGSKCPWPSARGPDRAPRGSPCIQIDWHPRVVSRYPRLH